MTASATGEKAPARVHSMAQVTGRHQSRSFPLGATLYPDGVNFSVFSRYATGLELLLFENADDLMPSREMPLDPQSNRTYYYWHGFVPGITAGQLRQLEAVAAQCWERKR